MLPFISRKPVLPCAPGFITDEKRRVLTPVEFCPDGDDHTKSYHPANQRIFNRQIRSLQNPQAGIRGPVRIAVVLFRL